jgi:hypothetical protein
LLKYILIFYHLRKKFEKKKNNLVVYLQFWTRWSIITAKSFSNNARRIHKYFGRVIDEGPKPLPAEFFFVNGGGWTFGRVILPVSVLFTDAALVVQLSPLYKI